MNQEGVSSLTAFLDDPKESEGDFLLPTPSDGDQSAITIRIYLFGTPSFLSVKISRRTAKVGDLIRHVMTLYKRDTLLSGKLGALQYPNNPEAFEMRLVDDDSGDKFKPYYEVGALDRRERVGEVESLAFVQAKGFKLPSKSNADIEITQKEIEELKK